MRHTDSTQTAPRRITVGGAVNDVANDFGAPNASKNKQSHDFVELLLLFFKPQESAPRGCYAVIQ